jgi:hypothetical protein
MPAKSMFDLALEGKELEASDLTGTELMVIERFNNQTNAQETNVIRVSELNGFGAITKELQITTASLQSNATATGSVPINAIYRLLTIATNAPCRVRLYVTAAKRNADLARQAGLDKPQGASMMLEFISVTGLLSADLSPLVDGFTNDGNVHYSVTNTGLAATAITATFNYIGF